MPINTEISLATILIASVVMLLAMLGYMTWTRERRYERQLRARQDEREEKRFEFEQRKQSAAEMAQYGAAKLEEEKVAASNSGAGSGGYIVIEMPERERPLFHDLLKGFEDYAKLKGYQIAFSIDASFEGRIAFKFTVMDDGVVVGAERVRKDFKEYVEQ